jgi:hypothetical protein
MPDALDGEPASSTLDARMLLIFASKMLEQEHLPEPDKNPATALCCLACFSPRGE